MISFGQNKTNLFLLLMKRRLPQSLALGGERLFLTSFLIVMILTAPKECYNKAI